MKIIFNDNTVFEQNLGTLQDIEEKLLESPNNYSFSKNYDFTSYGITIAIFLIQETISYFRSKADKERIATLESLIDKLYSETRRSNCDMVDSFLYLKEQGIMKVEFDEDKENEIKLAFKNLEIQKKKRQRKHL